MLKFMLVISLFLSTVAMAQDRLVYTQVGDSLIKLEEYDKALQYFNKELRKYPKNEDILRWIGYLHVNKKNYKKGISFYNKALKVNPNCGKCYLNIGYAYEQIGNRDDALKNYKKVIKADSTDLDNYISVAIKLEAMREYTDVLEYYNRAISKDSTNASYYASRAYCYHERGYYSLATNDYSKAIKLDSNIAEYFQYRAIALIKMKKIRAALEDINSAIAIDSINPILYTTRGDIYSVMQKYDTSIEDYTKSIELKNDNYLPYLNRASSFYQLENLDGVCIDYGHLEKFIKNGDLDEVTAQQIINSKNDICDTLLASYYYQRGIAYYNLKRFKEAVKIYSIGLNKFPNNSMLASFKANALMVLQEYPDAITFNNLAYKNRENYLDDIKKNPNFINASPEMLTQAQQGFVAAIYKSLAEANSALGHYEVALADIDRGINIVPPRQGKEIYYNIKGHIYLQQKKYNEAIDEFDKSIGENRYFSLAYVNRAIARVSLADKIKVTTYHVRTNTKPMGVKWEMPFTSLMRSKDKLEMALADCDRAISIDSRVAFSYYIRAQVKQLLMKNDFCMDFDMAQSLGLDVEEEFMIKCGK